MPTITEPRIEARKLPIAGLLAVATIWLAGMGIAAMAVRPDAVVGFGPPGGMTRMIGAVVGSDGYLLDAGKFYIAARTGPSTVRSLYAAGAWLVWPVIGKGCGRR
jgi:hypothetical protein